MTGYTSYKKQLPKLEVTDADAIAKGIIESALDGTLDPDINIEEDLGTWDYIVKKIVAEFKEFKERGMDPVENITNWIEVMKNGDEGLRILVTAIEENEDSVDDADSIPMPPEGLLSPEEFGSPVRVWLDAYVKWVLHWHPFVHPLYAEASGVWALSALAARRIVVKDMGKPIYPMLYIMLFAESSVGKTTSAEMAQLLIESLGLEDLLVTGQETPQAFVADSTGMIPSKIDFEDMTPSDEDALMTRLMWAGVRSQYRDEFGQELANMYSPNGVYKENKRIMLQWYGGGAKDGYHSQANGRNNVKNPYMSIIGCGTFSNVSDILSKGCYRDGLIPRCAPLGLAEQPYVPHKRVRGKINVPHEVLAPAHDFVNRLGLPQIHIEKELTKKGNARYHSVVDIFPEHEVYITEQARIKIDEYEEFLLRSAGEKLIHEDLVPCYKRMTDRLIRVATLLAWMGNGGEIDMRVITASMHIMERWRLAGHTFHEEVTKTVFTPTKAVENRIVKILEKQAEAEKPSWLSVKVIAGKARVDVLLAQRVIESLITAGAVEATDSTKRAGVVLYAIEGTPKPISKKQGRPKGSTKKVEVELEATE
jgi:hypothetical protein